MARETRNAITELADVMLRAVKDGGPENTDAWAKAVLAKAGNEYSRSARIDARMAVEEVIGGPVDAAMWSAYF